MRRLMILGGVGLLVLLCSAPVASAGTLTLDLCGHHGRLAGDGLSSTQSGNFTASAACPIPGGLLLQAGSGNGQSAGFKVTAPAGVVINNIHVIGAHNEGVGENTGVWGEFYWNGGPGPAGRSGAIDSGFGSYGCCSQGRLNSQSIGWFIACARSSCPSSNNYLSVEELVLSADEERRPDIAPVGADNLWYQNGWVRGTWPAPIGADDPSGVCDARVYFGSLPAPFESQASSRNLQVWHQCPAQNVSASIDTSMSRGSQGMGVGTMPLTLAATNAANMTASPSKTVYVDNSAPTVSVSGPSDAPSTAGTQTVTATAAAGPSGVSGISCSVDGGPYQDQAGASMQVSVSGIGTHTVTCVAHNNARAHDGSLGSSTPESTTVKIGQPTVVGISFSRLVGLRCHRVRERVTTPSRFVTVKRHGKSVRIRTRARRRVVRVMRCHPRTVRRRTVVFVTVRRHGRLVRVKRVRFVRVAVAPHLVGHSSKRVPFGHGTTVSGWLGTSSGTALPGQQVRVLSAPDDGLGHFSQVAVVSTAADGSWSARLPAGPSRLVEAAYGGDPQTEGASSEQVRVLVPARVRLLSVSPRRVPWGGTVRIVGELQGGYLPRGGVNVRLRYGHGRARTTYGIETHVSGNGRFVTYSTFGPGDPSFYLTYWFAIASLPSGNYPYAPAASGRRYVVVGGDPPVPAPRRSHHRAAHRPAGKRHASARRHKRR